MFHEANRQHESVLLAQLSFLFEYPAPDALRVSRVLFLNSLLIKADTCIMPIARAQ